MATKIVNSLAGLPAEVTVKKLVHRSNYEELWISFPESERIYPHCGSHDCTIKDSGINYTVYHSAVHHRSTHLHLQRKRYYCKSCQRTFMHNEPFPYKLYIQELETELTAAENTIHEAEESFQILRNDCHNLQEYVSILQDILSKNGISFPELYS